ncbi:MAG: hypothetical protein ACI9R3_001701, partial [Verrucomicrobiales bacterium]
DRFKTFRSFAAATLEEVYSPSTLERAHQLAATTLESGILINVTIAGQLPAFEFEPLPRLAQIAPVFGIAFSEVNGDGHPDLIIAQNFDGPQRETGRMAGGVSLLLVGDGAGEFTPVWPDQSGIVVGSDATSLTVADWNHDGAPDLFFGVNSGPQAMFQKSSQPINNSTLCVRLPADILPGTRVSIELKNGTSRIAEHYAGGGYLSQSPALVFFSMGNSAIEQVKHIRLQGPLETQTFQLDQLKSHHGAYRIP